MWPEPFKCSLSSPAPRRFHTGSFVSLFALTLFLALSSQAVQPSSASRPSPSFIKDLAPVLAQKCLDCHQASKSKGGYRLDTFEQFLRPGKSGKTPITPRSTSQSHLLQLLKATDEDDRMPQKADPLAPEVIHLFETWILEGAAFDGSDPKAPLAELAQRSRPVVTPPFYSHPISITALLPSPATGQLLIGAYGELLVWNVESNMLHNRIQGLPERILDIVPIPTGSEIAIAGGTPGTRGELWLVNLQSNSPPTKLLTSPDLLLSVSVSSDAKWIATAGTDASLRIYSLQEKKWLPSIDAHSDWIMHVRFSSDAKLLGSASRDKSAKVFQVPSMELLTTYYDHSEPVWDLFFSTNKNEVFSTSRAGQWHLWDSQEGKRKKDLGELPSDIVKLHPIGSKVAGLTSQGRVMIFRYGDSASKPEHILKLSEESRDEITALAWDESRQGWLTGSLKGRVQSWKPDSHQIDREFSPLPVERNERGASSTPPE